MTYNPCENTKITYSGNGSQTDFTFQFTYTDETDVIVWLYDDLKTEWIEQTNKYVFAGPTIIKTAPEIIAVILRQSTILIHFNSR